MDLTQTHSFIFLGLVAIAGGIGAYIGAYLKQKGKNLATHEDIDKLVEQVSAVTDATKKIEAEISRELWDKQRRWELKRDVLLETVRRMSAVDDALGRLYGVYKSSRESSSPDSPVWQEQRIADNVKWFKVLEALDETRLTVGITCGKEVRAAVSEFRKHAVSLAAIINKADHEVYAKSISKTSALKSAVQDAIRKELGLPSE